MLRPVHLAFISLGALGAVGMANRAEAQVLLNRNIPDPNLGFGADYLRRGSGYGSPAAGEAVGTTVLTRPHPEYDPQGVQLGSVHVDAFGWESLGYDSNPVGLSDAKGTAVVRTQATVRAASQQDRWGLNTLLSVDDFRYLNLSTINHTDYTAYLGGYYDIGRDKLQASFTHLKLTLMPTGVDNLIGNVVVPFTDDEFRVSYTTQFGRVTVIPDASFAMFRFQRSAGPDSVTTPVSLFNTDTNDRNVASVGFTGKYELSPGRDLVAVVRGINATFPSVGPGARNQDYNDIQVLGGLDIQTQGNFRYRALIGYETRLFDSSAISSENAPIFEGQVVWTATQLTTVTATISRQIADAVAGETNSFTYTSGRLQIDHEVRRNIVLTGFVQPQHAEYQGSQSSTVYDAGANLTYKINHRIAVVGSYEYLSRRNAGGGSPSFTDQIAMLTLKVSL